MTDARDHPPRARHRHGIRRPRHQPRRLGADRRGHPQPAEDLCRHPLNLAWGTGQVNVTMADFSREFSEATGINLQFGPHCTPTTSSRRRSSTRPPRPILRCVSQRLSVEAGDRSLPRRPHRHGQAGQGRPPLDLDDFPKAALEVYSRFGNKLMAIPVNGSVTFLVWNKKAFRDAGLDPDVRAKILAGGLRPRQQAGGRQAVRVQHAGWQEHPGRLHLDHRLPRLRRHLHRRQGHAHASTVPPGCAPRKFIVEQLQKISPPGNLTWDFPRWSMPAPLAHPRRVSCGAAASDAARSRQVGRRLRSWLVAHARGGAARRLGGSRSREVKEPRRCQALCRLAHRKENSIRLARLHGQPARISAFNDAGAEKKYPPLPGDA